MGENSVVVHEDSRLNPNTNLGTLRPSLDTMGEVTERVHIEATDTVPTDDH